MSNNCSQTDASEIASCRRTGPALTDEILIALMARGEQRALQTLFKRHYSCVYRFALRFVKDHVAAQDVVNDTFLIAWRQASGFEGRSRVATWLLGIARYRALGASKVRPISCEHLDQRHEETLIDPAERADARIQREERNRDLKQCLARLPRDQAVLIELHYFRELSLKEAATVTGLPLNTVKTRMFLARKKLARMLIAADAHAADRRRGEDWIRPKIKAQPAC
jgi:RNA polymerase sigma-70 factor (ECF subfamily)